MTTAIYARWDGVGRPFQLEQAPAPRLRAGHALVAIDLATVCGSDLHTVQGHRAAPCPSVLGHEQVGRVVEVSEHDGPRATDGSVLSPGDRVVWSVTVSCGCCDHCTRGLDQKCRTLRKYGHEPLTSSWRLSGGFATHCELLPGTAIVRVPEHVPDSVAAPASCATATVAAALAAAGPLAGKRLLVTGAGMLGVTAAAMAAESGAEVVIADPAPTRRALGSRFGATGGTPSPEAFDVAVELSGNPTAVADCIRSLRTGGHAVLAGSVFAGPPVGIDPEKVVRGLLRITGVHNYRAGDLTTAVDFLATHHDHYPFAELVAPAHPLDRIGTAVTDAAEQPDVLRQAVVP